MKNLEEALDYLPKEDGWYDGEGKATTEAAKETVRQRLALSSLSIQYYIYPTVEGGISVEWDTAHGAEDFTIGPNGAEVIDE